MKKFLTENGRTIVRLSRWLKIHKNWHPNRRNELWPYVRDLDGYAEGQRGFNPSGGLYVDYFVWKGKKWAIERFIALGGPWGGPPVMFEDENGKKSYIAGYDSENYHNPILIETDECYEHVRVYEEE